MRVPDTNKWETNNIDLTNFLNRESMRQERHLDNKRNIENQNTAMEDINLDQWMKDGKTDQANKEEWMNLSQPQANQTDRAKPSPPEYDRTCYQHLTCK